ncbi:mitochondrial dynamin GTPase Msp1 [Dispira simplex]|nr:mitochondrial dynamin GTPase Msp1 [Dispira simplex]
MQPATKKYVAEVAMFVVTQVAFYFGLKYIMSSMDPTRGKRKAAQQQSHAILKRLGVKDIVLSDYEQVILSEVILPEEIEVDFHQIGGLGDIISDLKESVIFPLNYPELFQSASGLLGAPKGIMLYGPPGCGKTMMAKALAKESGATFINLHMSTLLDKWFGESNRLVNAVFSLANKLQPTIIFIDEIDSFLRDRKSSDHEVTSMMKAEFMTLWDGLTTANDSRVLIMGATNRPYDIDSAILRRMPKRFLVSPPDNQQRKEILQLILQDVRLASDFDLDIIAQQTQGFSGSDLKELCRQAAMIPIREEIRRLAKTLRPKDKTSRQPTHISVRALRVNDFVIADHPNVVQLDLSEATLNGLPKESEENATT